MFGGRGTGQASFSCAKKMVWGSLLLDVTFNVFFFYYYYYFIFHCIFFFLFLCKMLNSLFALSVAICEANFCFLIRLLRELLLLFSLFSMFFVSQTPSPYYVSIQAKVGILEI